MDDFDLNDMTDFFQAGGVKVLSADEGGVKEVPKKRNGLSDDFIPGKRNHSFTEDDIKRVVKYMDIRAYCLKKMKNTKEYRKENWMFNKCGRCEEENMRVYMQGIFDACSDVLGWMEGRIDCE